MNQRPDIADHPPSILIVDDERHNRELLELMLTSEGFLLRTAASGVEALGMVAQQPPDLILLDVMMPGMDGYEVVENVKRNVTTSNIPVILITALGDRAAKLRGLTAGAEDFLTKPVDSLELRVRVRNLLRLKAYGDYYGKYSHMLEREVSARTADLVDRTTALEAQAAVLTEQSALLDLAQDAIVVRDMQGSILFWSRGAEVMYGWPSQEALGRNTSELLHTEFSEPPETLEATLLREGQWAGEAIHHKRDGTRATVDSRWALQRDADGAPVRILSIDNDITDRKQAAADFLLLTEREQSREEQLRFKDEFLSHVSHELRSPLTAIKQFTTILLGGMAGELNSTQSEYQQIVLKNVRQLQAMIDDLLEVTRFENGKLALDTQCVSVSDVLTDARNTLQITARAKGVTLLSELPADPPDVMADRTRLRQILIILLDNAIKFTSDGGSVTVECRLLEGDPRFLLLEVSDTGCGVSPEIGDRIFERLYQEPTSTRASRNGLGLGLYICKELVTRQGGRIWAKRRPQQGSIFSFTLPVASCSNSIARLLKDGRWPGESLALLVVEVRLPDGWSSEESHEKWSHQARHLLEHCLLPDRGVLLPTVRSGVNGVRLFVAAFTDEKGASALATRIRKQFGSFFPTQATGLTVLVSPTLLPPLSKVAGASTEQLVANAASMLEASIKSYPRGKEMVHE